MRLAGVVLTFIGLVAVIVGLLNGVGTLFAWNGRHAIDTAPLGEERLERPLEPVASRRYTVSVQVVFDRSSVPTREGAAVVEAKLPLVVRVTDRHGTVRAEARGWVDPAEPPNVLYGQSADERTMATTELSVERLVGPFIASGSEPLTVAVDLGADRVGKARILERRLVLYDDALPPRIRNAFVLAGAGAVALLAGLGIGATSLLRAWLTRRSRRKRGGIPAADVV